MEQERKVLIVYYDVDSTKRKVYNVIYNGVRLKRQANGNIPGLRSGAIGGLPINKSVWIVDINNKPQLDRLKQYLSVTFGVTIDYVVAVLDDKSIHQVWANYKFNFIRKVQSFIDKLKSKGMTYNNQVDCVSKYLDKVIESVEGVLMAFGFSDVDEREEVFASLSSLIKQVYPDLNLKKEIENVSN